MTIADLKHRIWDLTKDLTLIERGKALYKPVDAEGWRLVLDYVSVRCTPVKPAKRKSGAKITAEQYSRYQQAHEAWFAAEYPAAYKDGHYLEPVPPDIGIANGLQTFIVHYLDWSGGYGNRINTTGRKIGDKWIKGATKKGTGDISGVLNGRYVVFEVKIGRDKPSPAQLKQQERINKAGGRYYFTHSVEEFFWQVDEVTKQSGIFALNHHI